MTQSIDPALFVASGMDLRQFTVEATINAPAQRVYAAFADGDAFPKAFAPQRDSVTANIDLAIGGRYEWIWGDVGSNGCQVLSYIPDRMISFSWNAPPEQPESRALRTWVVVEFRETEGATAVSLTHLGFGREPHWDETFEYFQGAWAFVLEQFKANLE